MSNDEWISPDEKRRRERAQREPKRPDVPLPTDEGDYGSGNGQQRRSAKPFPSLSLADIIAMPLKDPLRRVSGLIGEGDYVTLLFGPSTAGKTFLTVNLVFALLLGLMWFGRKVLKCGVLYIAREGEDGFYNRVKAQAGRLPEGIDISKLPFRVITVPVNLGPSDDGEQVEKIIATIQEMNARYETPVGVVFYDNMRAVAPGMHENYSEEIEAFFAKTRTIARAISASPFIIDNTGKDAGRGARGTQAKFDLAETVIEAEQNNGSRAWNVQKVRDGIAGSRFGFQLENVPLGKVKDVDDADKEITSAVVCEADIPEHNGKPRRVSKSEQALEALYAALTDRPIEPPDKKYYPTNVTSFTTVLAFEVELEARGIVEAGEPEEVKDGHDRLRKIEGNKRSQHSRIKRELRRDQLYAEYKDICWCPEQRKSQ